MKRDDKETDFPAENGCAMTPPACLCGRIMSCIRTEKKIAASKKRVACFICSFALSIVAFWGAFFALNGTLAESEFSKLLSIILSNPGTAAANWQDFGMFFLETLPVTYLAAFLGAIFAFLVSLKYATKYLSNIVSLSKFLKINHAR